MTSLYAQRVVVVLTLVTAGQAWANVLEVGTNAGAKLDGMAGAGSAHVSGSTAAVVNPAGLAATDLLDTNLSFVGMVGSTQAPANGPGTESSTTSFVPLPMVTAAYRATRFLTAAVFFYTPSGAGATFEGVNFGVSGLPPRAFGQSMYDFEAGPALGFRLPWRIDVGVAYRVTWIRGSVKGYDPRSLELGAPAYTETTMSGADFTGFKLGIQANPIDRLRLGLAYRTPVTVDLSGKTKATDLATGAAAEMDITARVRDVDKLLAGVTYEWIAGVLLTSLDYERQLYSRSRDIVVTSPAGTSTSPQRFHDSNIVRLGGELRVQPRLPIRLGVGFFDDFRDHAFVNAAAGGAPAPTYLVSAGAGWAVTRTLDLDFAYVLMLNSGSLGAAGLDRTGMPGNYSVTTHAFALNVAYHR